MRRIVEAIEAQGSTLLLIGETGSGKTHLAQSAVAAFAAAHPLPVERVVVESAEHFEAQLSSIFGSYLQHHDHRILASSGEGRDVLLLLRGIDRYPRAATEMLEWVIRSKRVRLICTARQVAGAADRLLRDPEVQHHPVELLTLEQTGTFLAQTLGVERVAASTCRRWHELTLGNQHALMTLALAAGRRGAVQRARGVAWVGAQAEEIPRDFVAQLGELAEPEREVVELVSFAAPMHEPALLRLLDSAVVERLLARELLAVRTSADGTSALVTRLPVVGEAIRAHLSPARRSQLAVVCFEALDADIDGVATLSASGWLRLVRFGLEGGCPLPHAWLRRAMRATEQSEDLPFALRIALVSMSDEDPNHRAEGMLRAGDLARFLGDRGALHEALGEMRGLLRDENAGQRLDSGLRSTLELATIVLAPVHEAYPERGLTALDAWAFERAERGLEVPHIVHDLRVRFLALGGELRAVVEAAGRGESPYGLESGYLCSPARSFEALARVQRGEFKQALSLAEHARQTVLLQQFSPTFSGDLSGFVVFLAHWARGASQLTVQSLAEYEQLSRKDLAAVHARAGLVDLAIALSALQEGRWSDTVELSDRLLERLAGHDAFGLLPAAHAVSALALAVLGETERAAQALRHSRSIASGLAMAIRGIAECLQLRAQHWLRDPEILDHALEVAAWAREQGLAMVELEAVFVAAHETEGRDSALTEQAAQLAAQLDSPIADAILASLRSFGAAQPEMAEGDGRLLSELGIWLPLRPVEQLTGREREVALFTALGYPAKRVALQLHLSSRTVETHLAHVYEKLGLVGREELRLWFLRQREAI